MNSTGGSTRQLVHLRSEYLHMLDINMRYCVNCIIPPNQVCTLELTRRVFTICIYTEQYILPTSQHPHCKLHAWLHSESSHNYQDEPSTSPTCHHSIMLLFTHGPILSQEYDSMQVSPSTCVSGDHLIISSTTDTICGTCGPSLSLRYIHIHLPLDIA